MLEEAFQWLFWHLPSALEMAKLYKGFALNGNKLFTMVNCYMGSHSTLKFNLKIMKE